MSSVLQSVATYGHGEWDKLTLILLDEASIVGSMVATFGHYDDGTTPSFEVSTLHETGQSLV